MKKYLLWAVMAAVVITSCTDEEITNKSEENNAIEFRTLADKTHSRTSTTDATNILSFSLTAWWNGGDQYLFNGFDITRSPGIDKDGNLENINHEWSYSPTRYWPISGTIDFFAYSPASSVNVITDLRQPLNKVVNVDNPPLIKYTVPSLLKSGKLPEDFLVSVRPGRTGINKTVTLVFQHALSKVQFKAMKQNDLEFTVYGVELKNLKSDGELTLKKDGGKQPSEGIPMEDQFSYKDGKPITLWGNQSGKKDYGIDMGNSPIYVLPKKYYSMLGDHSAMMIMPQITKAAELIDGSSRMEITELKADDPSESDPSKLNSNKFYILVKYKAFLRVNNNITYYAGNEKDPANYRLALPDDFTFEIGRSYTFNLTFGEEGSTSGAIKFEVDTQTWVPEDDIEI